MGEKTATKLIKEFGILENLYQKIQTTNCKLQNALRIKLLDGKAQAFLSRDLVKIKKDVPLDFSLEKCQWKSYNKGKITQILKEFEFYSLIERLPELK